MGALGLLALGRGLQVALSERARLGPIPSLDVAEYSVRAARLAESFELVELTAASVHPPMFPLVLALAQLRGLDPEASAALVGLMSGLGLVLLVALGWRLRGGGGAVAGLASAAVFSSTDVFVELALVPMTEPLALVWALGALVAWTWAGWRGALVAGALVALAGLTRYSALPLLALPLALDALLRGPDWRGRLSSLGALLGPGLLLFGLWVALEPELPGSIERFLRNEGASGQGALSWVAPALLRHGGWALLPAMVLALGGLFLARRGPTRALALVTAALFLALSLHPFQLVRNLHGLIPLLVLLAALGPSLHERPGARWLGLGLAALLSGLSVARTPSPVSPQLIEDRQLFNGLETLRIKGGERPVLLVGGAHRELNAWALEYWLRAHDSPQELELVELGRDCGEPDRAAHPSCRPERVLRFLDTPGCPEAATFASIERVGAEQRRGRRQLSTVYAQVLREELATRGLPELDRLEVGELVLTLYRTEADYQGCPLLPGVTARAPRPRAR